MNRRCAACNRNLSRDSYSKNEYSKGPNYSRCYACANSGPSSGSNTVDASQTARKNDASEATFTAEALNNPFAAGSFRWVAKGTYTHGNRAGESTVCKWFKSGGVVESHFYDTDLSTVEEAIRLISKWNSERLIDRMVKINKPEVWTFQPGSGFAGRNVLQEPFIENYQKFNSNTGWADDSTPWPRVMQALSHFSYHTSNGQCLLCDLQGGVYSDGVVLTDPVVMSISRSYGPTDLGLAGMNSFFSKHTCNEYCRSEWKRLLSPKSYHSATKGTTMEHVPTRSTRPNMTMGGAIHRK